MPAGTREMKYRKFGARLLAVASTVGLALLIASCGASNTVDFVYVTSNLQNPGQINVYELDSESGTIHQIADSPYSSGGRNPVYEVASPNGQTLYVANHDDNTIVMFAIGTDGKLYPLQTVTTPGTEPVALALNSTGTELYVLDYYAPAAPNQPSYTDLNPGPGAVIAYPISISASSGIGTLGTPVVSGGANYFTTQCFPSNLTVTPNGNEVYVTNTNAVVVTTSPPVTGTIPTLPTSCPDYGTVSEFAVNGTASSSGQTVTGLTPLTNVPLSTGAGSQPTGIATDPDGSTIYVTDSALNQVYAYTVQSDGTLSLAATVPSGTEPMGATVAGTSSGGTFLYVTNYSDGSISSYSLSGGIPTPLATTSAGTSGPTCVMIEPDLQRFLYTSDYIGGKIGGAEVNPSTGILSIILGSPYASAGQPTCVVAIPHVGGRSNGL